MALSNAGRVVCSHGRTTGCEGYAIRGGFILELASMHDVQYLLAEARTGKRFLRAIGRRFGTLASAKNKWVRLSVAQAAFSPSFAKNAR